MPRPGMDLSTYSLPAEFSAPAAVIFADMTGTLLHQRPGGFPAAQRAGIRRFLEMHGVLVLVTGDSYATVLREFVTPLDYHGSASVFLVTGAGYRIDCLTSDEIANLHIGGEFASGTRRALAALMEQTCRRLCEPGFSFAPEQLEMFAGAAGYRTEIGGACPALKERCFFEIIPNKCTVFLPDNPLPGAPGAGLLNTLARDPETARLAAAEHAHIILNNNSLDIILSLKEDGVRTLYRQSTEFSRLAAARNVLALGDSRNDEGLLSFPFPTSGKIMRVLVGEDDELFARLRQGRSQSEYAYLKGQYSEGAARLFEQICA